MTPRTAATLVDEPALRASRAPTAELAAAALRAQDDATLDRADFIIIAVEPGRGVDVLPQVRAALTSAT